MKNRVWVIEMRHFAQKKWMVLTDAVYSGKKDADIECAYCNNTSQTHEYRVRKYEAVEK
jgi:hypothetical protein